MRKRVFVPRITGLSAALSLLLLLTGCGGVPEAAAEARSRFQNMAGAIMEAEVSCDWQGSPWTALLRCAYVPGGRSVVQALSPETIRGVQAVLEPAGEGERLSLQYAGKALDAGAVSRERITPASCLPRMLDAIREGWLLEENREDWGDVPCVRLAVDQTGETAEKVYTTVWVRQEDGTPLRGEIAVDGVTIFTAEFTNFVFYDTINQLSALLDEG